MIHLVLLLVCVISIETFFRFGFIKHFKNNVEIIKKVIRILPSAKISDHWKEVAIPNYSLSLMRGSIQIFLILVAIICFFLIANLYFKDFISHSLSLGGFVESLLFVSIYIKVRNLIWDQ